MSSKEAIVSEHSTEWHWWAFSDFCKLKSEVSEPSPHLQMIGEITEGRSLEDKIWFSCLYAAFYNIPTALMAWMEWPWERVQYQQLDSLYVDFTPWLEENWKGLATRTERRAVRSIEHMNECISSLAWWSKVYVPGYLKLEGTNENYDRIWQETDQKLRYMGRYIIIRLLEALHRFVGLQPRLYDIRSIGGWSPKRALGLLYPEHLGVLLSSDTRDNVRFVDSLAFECISKIKDEYGVEMSPYVFAAMLCEYRVCYENRHQYPGWTIDQEPAYLWKIAPFWDMHAPNTFLRASDMFFRVRESMFPDECLGELNDWANGTRVEPRRVLRDYGYNWIDTKYNYSATKETGDWAHPVTR